MTQFKESSVEVANDTEREWNLPDLLAHRQWVRREWPFPYIVAQNVFKAEFYQELDAQFRDLERTNPEMFRRDMKGYDASATELSHHCDGPLSVFASRSWHDMLAKIWGVQATGDVAASLHHHEPGGASGWPHNDLANGWYPDRELKPDEVQLSNSAEVNYYHGRVKPETPARETVRAVALLYYLGNPEWQPGDGGETGLFTTFSGAGQGPAVVVPPINNSLVMFECTPFSWHAFQTNRTPRNSLVWWLHRTKEDAVARWGEQSIVYW
ncbi:2OG-Fe(II) oxygenase [Nocardioides jensenii]|uniref:2OG-Fe(II) oxygenase n=1 Tax=Nocardioides jensenii TaxID=1843 RepID=UPI000830DA25|nr:2OG-Fe(II) oxygenase [Nocardioides jensenii]